MNVDFRVRKFCWIAVAQLDHKIVKRFRSYSRSVRIFHETRRSCIPIYREIPRFYVERVLAILDIASVETLRSAISQGKAEYLTKVSGIGRKTAEKIILELREKGDGRHQEASDPKTFG